MKIIDEREGQKKPTKNKKKQRQKDLKEWRKLQ